MRAIRITENGGPEVLSLAEMPEPVPEAGQIVVGVAASGVNFVDTYQRIGLYPIAVPYTAGLEGAGVVTAVADGVAEVAVGDRVAWCGGQGSYAESCALDAAGVVPVPEDVSLDTAAGAMLQGLTAHYLVVDTFPLEPGHRCLIHAGAGGTGLLLIQMAKRLGAEVFTTVGTPAKGELAADAGADHVILYNDVDFAEAIVDIAGPRPLDVVYDGVGAAVFDASLGLLRRGGAPASAAGLGRLRRRGPMAPFGNASGPVPPIPPLRLSQEGSLYLTRPTLWDHVGERADLLARSQDLFDWITEGMDVRIGLELPLAEAAEAHRRLEGRATTGKILLRT